MINIATLTESDVGKWVVYRGMGGELDHGRIKSWNDEWIYVVYRCDNWQEFRSRTGVATSPNDLTLSVN